MPGERFDPRRRNASRVPIDGRTRIASLGTSTRAATAAPEVEPLEAVEAAPVAVEAAAPPEPADKLDPLPPVEGAADPELRPVQPVEPTARPRPAKRAKKAAKERPTKKKKVKRAKAPMSGAVKGLLVLLVLVAAGAAAWWHPESRSVLAATVERIRGAEGGTSHLPLRVGAGWVLIDDKGESTMRVGGIEKVADVDCLRIEWSAGGDPYQVEFWEERPDGIWVHGRRVANQDMPFEAPYCYLLGPLEPGAAWEATIAAAGVSDTVAISVGEPESVEVPAGTYEAVPVVYETSELRYTRWFAPGTGLVQERVAKVDGSMDTTKRLVRLLQP